MDKKILESLRKFALQNGVKFDTVNAGAVISKVIGEHHSAKDHMKDIQKELQKIIKEVNAMSKPERLEELKDVAPELLEEKKVERREGLKDLPNVKIILPMKTPSSNGVLALVQMKPNVVLRFAPSPSGPLHIGHAYILGLNDQYRKQYKGKLILRLEDTNPDNVDIDAYKMIPEDANWLTDNGVSEVIIQSDRMETYMGYALRLIEEGFAYVCTCETEVFKDKINNKSICDCRRQSKNAQLIRWKKMLTEYDDGDAVVRLKTDIEHPNPAYRDFPLLRINTTEHPKQGLRYRVWPLMNFSVAIDDMEMGVTHKIVGKDHADNTVRQSMIQKALKGNTPEGVYIGRINFEGFDLSTTQTKKLVKEQHYTGWDDIRLPFLRAMKRKGYQAAALRKFAVSMGVTQTDKTVSQEEFLKTLMSFNKEIIDPIANRYFALLHPSPIVIENAPKLEFEQDLHPDNKQEGRKFKTHTNFYIDENDLREIKSGQLIRLMGCLNFVKKGKKFLYHSKEYGEFRKFNQTGSKTSMVAEDTEFGLKMDSEGKQIHWLPQDQSQIVKIRIKLDDNSDVEAFAEKAVENVKVNDIVQFERFGFCRCDAKNSFWHAHR